MKTVLITGAAGYLASHLIDFLLDDGDYVVVGMDNNWKSTSDTLIPFISDDAFFFFPGDVTNEDDVKKVYKNCPDYVIHMAAIVGAPACNKYRSLSSLVNVEGTHNIVKHKPSYTKLIYCNTGSIYAPGAGVCDENSPVDAKSHYAKTKLAGEFEVLSAKNTISHRYATAMGVSKTNMRVNLLANDLTYQAVTEKTLTLFEPHFMRTFIHCYDIANSIFFTMKNFDGMLDKQRVYNVGNNDMNFTKGQLAQLIQEQTGCHINFAETEKDPDQRDYGYDSSAIYSFGWRPIFDMSYCIKELIKVTPLLTPWDKYR